MKLTDYLWDRGMLLLLHLICMCLAATFFRLTGYDAANILLFLTVWALVLAAWFFAAYFKRRKFFREALGILEQVDQRYLLGELLPYSPRLEDRLYREMLRSSNKSCIERVRRVEDGLSDYREYIESWVHEIKAPITGIAFLCANRREKTSLEADDYLTVLLENQKIENYVDMVLYYARSEEVYKDYLIRETCLEDVVCEVLEKNHLLLIQNRAQAQVDCNDMAYTDRKWIGFILHQMILNSVKYQKGELLLRISTRPEKSGVVLTFEDNGLGIPREELPRIFDKGFTGSNGRDQGRSTGMGLYLCQKLCDRLGIGLSAESEYGIGTKLYLEFPISTHIREIRED